MSRSPGTAVRVPLRFGQAGEETTPLGTIDRFGPIAGPAEVFAPMAVGLPHPNPSKGAVSVSLTLPAPGAVRVELFDALGRQRGRLLEAELPAGAQVIPLELRSESGAGLPAGHYWLRMTGGGAIATRSVLLVD